MQNEANLLWYVCYGSNLSGARFLCYIQGGTPKWSKRSYTGCINKSLPLASEKCSIRHQLYFARDSEPWCGGGVAFIKSNPLPACEKRVTLGRKYLITKDQFIHVVLQENGKDADDSSININLDVSQENSQFFIGPKDQCCWYGRIVNLGTSEGFSMFTCTAKWDDDFDRYNPPSDNYLKAIIEGLKETYRMSEIEIVNYLALLPGIDGKKSREELESLVRRVNRY